LVVAALVRCTQHPDAVFTTDADFDRHILDEHHDDLTEVIE
jgi:hypothetical protein